MFDRVQIQPRDAREASDVFYKQGQGDALLNYENEVIFTNKTYGDDRLPYISPDNNVQVHFSSCGVECLESHYVMGQWRI